VLSSTTGLLYNPFDPVLRADPYPTYQRLRDEAPVHRSPLGFWVVSRYGDVSRLLADTTLDFYPPEMYGRIRDAMTEPDSPASKIGRWLLFTDRREHRRFRGLLNSYFSPNAVAKANSLVQDSVDAVLARFPTAEPTDFVAGLARPLPMNVLCDWIGVPREDREQCREWAASIGRVLVAALNPEITRRMGEAVLACDAYFRVLIAERRAAPRDDLLTALLGSEHGGTPITEDELVADLILLLGASSETTVNMLSMGMLSLLRNPAELERLRSDPELARTGVDELLRYDSPSQLVGRYTGHDLQVGDETIPAGTRLSLLIGAANRDPDRFPDPDRLDLSRPDARPLSFGLGAHHCIGAWLARLEVETVLRGLVERFGRMSLVDGPLAWRSDAVALRAPAVLPVEVSAA
jgi:cytochrome P450